MCTEVNSAMGLQATAATKRKHEITFDGKDANTTYTSGPPPHKTSKWSINNNYIEAIDREVNGIANVHKTTEDTSKSQAAIVANNCNNNNGDSKNCSSSTCSGSGNSTATTNSITTNGKEVTTTRTSETAAANNTGPVSNGLLVPPTADVVATTPLPPTLSTPVPEDSIAKLEVVAAVPCEPWSSSNPEPVDCISKLQAVAVPSDPWGSISTRSTLATTLLSADELDDDDDDFEDDYEEDESIIPTYCPLRYHPFVPSASTALHQPQRLASYSPTHGYGTRPNYYSEPFPQQNCSRTGSAQHMRLGSSGFTSQWQNGAGGSNGNQQQFYVPPEAAYPPQQQQQTIRCAENGKSYLELGCSSPPPNAPPNTAIVPPPPPFNNVHVPVAGNLDARHALKRCCDGRGTWCNTNKNCYKDIRLKIRNLSMFKLSRFRQVSEQSLYRSVLICNTLKRIDREIEAEAKELHQAAAHAHMQQTAAAAQYHQHLHSHLQHHAAAPHHSPPPQPQHHLAQQQPPPPPSLVQHHQDYSPVMNCARLANMDYQAPLQQHPAHQQQFQQQQQQSNSYLNQPERLDTPPPPPYHLQKPPTAFAVSNSNCDAAAAATSTLHPYDHYPFRESQSGRATPFPCQPVSAAPAATPQAQQAPTIGSSVSTAAPPTAATAAAAAPAITTLTPAISLLDSDSGYVDDDSTRSINWSSVLSLSSQSALDPLNNNDLFSILPPATSVTNPATAVPVPLTAVNNAATATHNDNTSRVSATAGAVAISGTFSTVATTSTGSSNNSSASSNITIYTASSSVPSASTSPTLPSSSTTATFTTLSTISSATHSLTASYVSSLSASVAASSASNSSSSSTWEYGFLDMEFGLGSEFTELMPSCKLSSDELFKSGLTPVATSRYSSVVHDNELEQPAHIMVGS